VESGPKLSELPDVRNRSHRHVMYITPRCPAG
jgi:hypothetical protein